MRYYETLFVISFIILFYLCVTAIIIIPKQGGIITIYILVGSIIVYFCYDCYGQHIEYPEAVLAVYGENENQIAIQMPTENENEIAIEDVPQTEEASSIQVDENENQIAILVSDNPLHNA